MEKKGARKMRRRAKKRTAVKIIIITIILAAAAAGISVAVSESEAATEKAVSDRTWSDVESVIKKKLGEGYSEAGLCTGYLYWCLKNAYGVDWGSNSTVGNLEKKLTDHGITKVAEGTDGKITSNMRPGDIVIFLNGGSGTHCAVLGDGGKLYHARSSAGVSCGPTLEKWMDLPDRSKNCDSYRVYRGLSQEIDIRITVKKCSADERITEDNPCYSLEGARYEAVCGGKSVSLVTDEKGVASGVLKGVTRSEADKVEIKETEASHGYAEDTGLYVKDGSNGSVEITSYEPPVRNPVETVLIKKDRETGKYENGAYIPQKGGRLGGAVFKVDFFGEETCDEALRTWYFETDDSGFIKWDEDYFAAGYQQSELFYEQGDHDQVILPLGTVRIEEVLSPEGYITDDNVYICNVVQNGEGIITDTYCPPEISEQIKRGDLSLRKTDELTQESMAGVPFRITSLQEDGKSSDQGESHIVVTDVNGYASTADSFNRHSHMTNFNDKVWDGSEEGMDPDSSAGIWFGDPDMVNDDLGALPYGRYIVDELPCDANEGYTLVKGIEIMVTRDDHVIELGNVINKKVKVRTEAQNKRNGGSTAEADGMVTIIDEIYYDGLTAGECYEVRGVLMDKDTGEPAKTEKGQIISYSEFIPENSRGRIIMEFTFDASSMEGKELVAFEEISLNERIIAHHRDIGADEQTVKIMPKPDTEAEPPVRTGDDAAEVVLPALLIMTFASVLAVYTITKRKKTR